MSDMEYAVMVQGVLVECRPEVARFAREMELVLARHDYWKGPTGWKDDEPVVLAARVLDEAGELHAAAIDNLDEPNRTAMMRGEAIDTANMAMMVWDVLTPETGDRG